MCSILGQYSNTNLIQVERFKCLNSLLSHRGPDYTKLVKGHNFIFGHNLLSIIDSDQKFSIQPYLQDGYSMVFNGEIYNFKEISAKLTHDGIECSGLSDSEVLFKSLIFYGLDKTLEILDGMYAFAFLDPKKGLFLARDKLGEKPLYWKKEKNSIWFSSEIKVLSRLSQKQVGPNLDNLDQFFYHGKIYGEKTFFEQVLEVEPGKYIHFEDPSLKPKTIEYWAVDDINQSVYKDISYESIMQGFKSQFIEAVKTRTISDVQIGLMLSGGIDSNSILRALLDFKRRDIPLFFANNLDYDSSEINFVESYLNFFRENFPDNQLNLYQDTQSKNKYLDSLEKFSWFHDEPIQFPISPQLFSLTRIAKENNIKVLLSGEGADELLYGYDRFFRTKGLINSNNKKDIIRNMYFGGGIGNEHLVKKLIVNKLSHKEDPQWIWLNKNISTFDFDTLQLIYSQKFRLQSLLQRQDRIGMANGVEVRVPFLSPKFVKFCNNLPINVKTESERRKKILFDFMENKIPKNSEVNYKKMGSTSFIISWLNSHMSRQYITKIIRHKWSFSKSYLDFKVVEKIIENHYDHGFRYTYLLWLILSLEFWQKSFINVR